MTDPAQTIRAAFPGSDDLHRSVRIALLRVLHFGTAAETECAFVAEWLDHILEEPPWCIGYGPVRPLELVQDLRHTANELERAVHALDAASKHWARFIDSQEEATDAIGIRQGGGEPGPEENTGAPF